MTTKKSTSKLTPKIYSYIRYSTKEQSHGDSEKRQLEQAIAYADKNPLDLDDTMMFDRGLSGYHGTHKRKGALGNFLLRVERGEIARGSILLIENVDRLSREPLLTAFGTFTDLLNSGIGVQTLQPEAFYDKKALNEGWAVFELIGQMKNAHASSDLKAGRVKEARDSRREAVRNGTSKIFTKRVPAWLEVKKDKNKNEYIKAIPEAADTIKDIFDLYLAGNGLYAIEKKLNQEAVWMPPPTTKKKKGGNGWRKSYIAKILKNPAVIGWFQPYEYVKEVDENGNEKRVRKPAGKVIKNHFDPVVDQNTFFAVQKKFEQKTYIDPASGKKRVKSGGKTGKVSNIFTHIVKCAYCGGPMRYENKGSSSKGGKVFICDNARRDRGCEKHRISYDEVEYLILNACRRVKAEHVLPNPTQQTKLCQQLHKRIDGQKAKIDRLESKKTKLRKNIAYLDSPKTVKECQADILELEHQIVAETEQLKADKIVLQKTQSDNKSFVKWRKDIASLQKHIKDNPEARMKLREYLKQFIEQIKIYPVGFKELYDENKDDGKRSGKAIRNGGKYTVIRGPHYYDNVDKIEEYCYDVSSEVGLELPDGKFCEFVDEMVKRRMSKEGRFVRVHYTSGAWIDFVPEDSIASGKNIKGEWTDPKILEMCENWINEQ